VKQSVPVDKLSCWAFEELQKRYTSSAEGMRWDNLGFGPIQTGRGGGGQRYDFGIPHKDAETIEAAVDALDDCQIDWETHHTAIMGPFDALFMAHDVLLTETIKPSALIRYHGIMKTRPAWGRDYEPFPSRVQPARGPSGAAAIVGECRGRDLYSTGAYCPIKWCPSVIELARQRANYVGWHDGLGRLCMALRGSLEAFDATAPEVAPEPWNRTDAPRRVLSDLITRPLTRLPDHWPRPMATRRPQMRLGSAYPVSP
jgi:hypothetical protein